MDDVWSVSLPENASAAAWEPGGARVAVATLAGVSLVLDVASGAVVHTTRRHAGGALTLDFHPTRRGWLCTGGQDGRLRLHDIDGRGEVCAPDAGGPWVARVAFARDGLGLASAAGRAVRFWSADGDAVSPAVAHASTVSALFEHPTIGWVSACYGGVAALTPGQAQPARRFAYRGAVVVAAPSDDGRYIAAGNQDATVRVWDTRGKQDANLTGYPAKVRALAWGSLGPLLATGGGAHVVLWNCSGRGAAGTQPQRLEGHTRRVSALAFLRDGLTLLSGGEDGRLIRWRARDDDGVFSVEAERDLGAPIHALSLSPDQSRVLVACADARARALTVAPTP